MMIDWLWLTLKWLAITAAVSPIVIGIGWGVVEGSILPRLVPGVQIEAMADAVMRDHAEDPEEWALMEEHVAWCRSHTFEQGKWRRVRRAIRRRLLVGDLPPSA